MTARGCAMLLVMLGVWACAREPAGAAGPEASQEPSAGRDTIPEAEPPQPEALLALPAVLVTGFTGPGGKPFEVLGRTFGFPAALSRQIGMQTFTLTLRLSAPMLTQYPCATCHQGVRVSRQPEAPAHENIRLEHPRLAEGACGTCHVPEAVERLALAGGASTTLDHPYRLCAQCHFAQVDSWAGGGHGKRMMAWGGRRVVMNCTNCHDPHRPAVEPRIPFPGPRIRRSGDHQ